MPNPQAEDADAAYRAQLKARARPFRWLLLATGVFVVLFVLCGFIPTPAQRFCATYWWIFALALIPVILIGMYDQIVGVPCPKCDARLRGTLLLGGESRDLFESRCKHCGLLLSRGYIDGRS
jgi:hypothetical protein